jgi:hypothetical protein
MTTSEILQQLERIGSRPPTEALHAAVEQKESMIPELISALNRVTEHPADYVADVNYTLYIYALYLLAQFREPRALEPFLKFFSLPGELAPELTGDLLTENGAELLASVCAGNPEPLLRLAQDEAVNDLVRGQAVLGLVAQAAWGERSCEEAIETLRQLFVGGLSRPGRPHVWAELVAAVCYLNAAQLLPEVRQVFQQRLVDEEVVTYRHAEDLLCTSNDRMLQGFAERHPPITDTAAFVAQWIVFQDAPKTPETNQPAVNPLTNLAALRDDERPKPAPYIAETKVGRNGPCPCGSGLKYKKCCGKG